MCGHLSTLHSQEYHNETTAAKINGFPVYGLSAAAGPESSDRNCHGKLSKNLPFNKLQPGP